MDMVASCKENSSDNDDSDDDNNYDDDDNDDKEEKDYDDKAVTSSSSFKNTTSSKLWKRKGEELAAKKQAQPTAKRKAKRLLPQEKAANAVASSGAIVSRTEKGQKRRRRESITSKAVGEVASATSTATTPDPAETKPAAKRRNRKHEEYIGAEDVTHFSKNSSEDTGSNQKLKVKKKKNKNKALKHPPAPYLPGMQMAEQRDYQDPSFQLAHIPSELQAREKELELRLEQEQQLRMLSELKTEQEKQWRMLEQQWRMLEQMQSEQRAEREQQLRLELEQRAEREQQLRLELEQRAEREQQLRLDFEQRAERDQQLRLELEQRQNGTYYSFFNEVWKSDLKCYEEDHFRDLFRESIPTSDKFKHNEYVITYKAALEETNVTADQESHSSHGSTTTKNEIWPVDILNVGNSGNIVHLIPASKNNASFYQDVAKWVFGLSDRESRGTIEKVINGSNEVSSEVINGSNKVSSRIASTGLKHFTWNKIRIRDESFFDGKDTRVLIVPIMSVEAAKNWRGEKYNAIFMLGLKGEPSKKTLKDTRSIAASVGLTLVSPESLEASDAEVETAAQLLKAFLLGLAWSVRRSISDCKNRPDRYSEYEKEEYNKLESKVIRFDGTQRILVPKGMQTQPSPHRVLKISLGDDGGHPAPDPMFLSVKAAYVWSTFHDERLIAGGSVKDDDDDDELSALAEDMYLTWRESKLAAQRQNELIGMSIAF